MKSVKMHELIGRYLAGEVADREREEFLQWIENSDENKKEFELHKNSWEATRIKFDSQNGDVVFRKILNKIDEDQEHEISRIDKGDGNRRRFNISMIAKIAASLIVFATLGYFIILNSSTFSGEKQTVSIITKENPSGQKSKIFLPDGSEVWLNAESSISFPEVFTDSVRTITLEGEAFFNVIKKAGQPFIVRAGEVSTTVLGTSFNVQAFKNESTAYVALQSGKIKVEIENDHGNQEMFLEPGQGIRYDRSSHITVVEEFDEEKLLGWKDGIISFKDANLEEIVSTLSRWYGVQIVVKNRTNENWEYTGRFRDVNLESVLNQIAYKYNFSIGFEEQNMVIINLN